MNIKVTPEICFFQIWKTIFVFSDVAFIKAIDKQKLTPASVKQNCIESAALKMKASAKLPIANECSLFKI